MATLKKKKTKIGFQGQLLLNAGQKYCRELQGEHSAILLTYIRARLGYNLSLRSLFCLLLSGHFTQILLYAADIKSRHFHEKNIGRIRVN